MERKTYTLRDADISSRRNVSRRALLHTLGIGGGCHSSRQSDLAGTTETPRSLSGPGPRPERSGWLRPSSNFIVGGLGHGQRLRYVPVAALWPPDTDRPHAFRNVGFPTALRVHDLALDVCTSCRHGRGLRAGPASMLGRRSLHLGADEACAAGAPVRGL